MGRRGENIRKRNDGRWEARCICGYREDGRARYKYIYAHTYAEVRNRKNAFLTQQSYIAPNSSGSPITVRQLLMDWLKSVKPNVKESTYVKYVFLSERHIVPVLGNISLSTLTSEKIDSFTYNKLNYGSLKGGRLASKTVVGILSVLKQALAFGAERHYPCPGNLIVRNPRQTLSQIQILSVEEQKILENYAFASGSLTCVGIIISLYTGLRIGEICALRWEDFNFKNNTLYVQRTIMRIADISPDASHKTKIIMERPKTECSNRMIPLPSFLVNYLEEYRRDPSFYVVTGRSSYIEPRGYYLKYKRIMKNCGLQQFNYHALRHTFATRCVETGFDLKSLSEILGHADVSITLQKYVHPSMQLKRQHMETLESVAVCGRIFSQRS